LPGLVTGDLLPSMSNVKTWRDEQLYLFNAEKA
jgi:hypothetical protein